MTYYPASYTESVTPDIIAQSVEGTYVGWFDRKNYNRTLPPEEQPIWRIRLIQQTEISGFAVTKYLYPEGWDEYSYVWNNRESLTYKYLN